MPNGQYILLQIDNIRSWDFNNYDSFGRTDGLMELPVSRISILYFIIICKLIIHVVVILVLLLCNLMKSCIVNNRQNVVPDRFAYHYNSSEISYC